MTDIVTPEVEVEVIPASGRVKGRFAKGNRIGKGRRPKEQTEIKKFTKTEIYECAMILTLPFSMIKEIHADQEKLYKLSCLEKLTVDSIVTGDKVALKHITWLLEMVVGKASQQVDLNTTNEKPFRIEYRNGMVEALGINNTNN